MPELSLSIAIPASQRVERLKKTLSILMPMVPLGSHFMVHVDGNSSKLRDMLQEHFPCVSVLSSTELLGPGGSRDRLIKKATTRWILSFDDDSFPESPQFFLRLQELIALYPNAAIICADVTPPKHRGEAPRVRAVFPGCGALYNRDWYLQTDGYVPRSTAYGMEETDLSLQLANIGGEVIWDPGLVIVHESNTSDRGSITRRSEMIQNAFLLPWIRYPASLLWLGLLQAVRYLTVSVTLGEWRSIVIALGGLPNVIAEYRRYRRPVSAKTVWRWIKLRRLDPHWK